MNWIGVETTTAWTVAMVAAALGVGFVAAGMMEDLFEIARQWWGSDDSRSTRNGPRTPAGHHPGRR
jgi:hypothetical protein